MGINMKIHNVKNIDDFEMVIPIHKGLYALTGENASGKSTVISCAAAVFYIPSLEDYFGKPRDDAYIEFEYKGKYRCIQENVGKWKISKNKNLGVTGFYEGSIVYGNRFKDIDYSMLSKLSAINEEHLIEASEYVRENLGKILHDDSEYYKELYVIKNDIAKKMNLSRMTYFYKNKGSLISQLNMSTGENLLLTILCSIEKRENKLNRIRKLSFLFLDEIELALHSSALRRLVYFLNKLAIEKDTVVLFSTHSIELIRTIPPKNIYYLQHHVNGTLELINPCYPVYATRNLESSKYGYDYLIMVEDNLAKKIVDRILIDERLLSNKRVLVIAVGGWTQVLRFTYEMIAANLVATTKILIILDGDIESDVNSFMRKEKIGFSNQPKFLPIKSLEKYLLDKLIKNVDMELFRELNDYVFQQKSLDIIISEYSKNIKEKKINNEERIKTGKYLFSCMETELERIRKSVDDLIEIVVKHIFSQNYDDTVRISEFLEEQLLLKE